MTMVSAILAHANEVHELARRGGRTDLADALREDAGRWQDGLTTVVVAGAQKRGKSTMLNALVGRPGLLPVDADVATRTYLALCPGPRLSATVLRDGGTRREPIDPDDIDRYASVWADRATVRDVTGVEITTDHPVLTGLRLLDTPGVDGLDLGHKHTTMAVLRTADALLFTVSAEDEPVLRHELEFLAEAAERLNAVAFVLTKTDSSANWRELLRENQRRVAEHVARNDPDGRLGRLLTAPWFPVSARLLEAAAARRTAGQQQRADDLRARSGFDDLIRYLRSCVGRRELLRAATVLATAGSALRALRETLTQEVTALGEQQDVARAEQDSLNQRLIARQRFATEHQFLGRETGMLARGRLEAIRRDYERQIENLSSRAETERYLAELPESLELSIMAARAEIIDQAQARFTATLPELLNALGLEPIELRGGAVRTPSAEVTRPDVELATAPRLDLLRDGIPAVSMGGSLGMLLFHVGAGVAGAGWLGPAAVIAGPALAIAVVARRRRLEQVARDKSALKRAVLEMANAAGAEIALTVERTVADWWQAVNGVVDEALARRRADLARRRGGAARSPAQRAAAERAAREQLVEAERLHDRQQTLTEQIRAAPPRDPATSDRLGPVVVPPG
ncbi:dynamin family protein [Actinoplanes regularis]|uniref:dynamin family protein n=1 Tax=Actinoplanes regularis TaxID=52697 RepID=UPI0024A14FD9|nr:dynamin family protein [Actinoplanes regularis]GLW35617.1 dynamin [Actinoplanes regularis]